MSRIFFARAVDGIEVSRVLASAWHVSKELAAVGLVLVDPVATEPHDLVTSSVGQARYEAIVDHDLAVLRSCSAVLMDMSLPNRNYIGCSCELVYAFQWQLPCAVYMGENEKNRPWLKYHAAAVFKDRSEAIRYLVDVVPRVPE